MRSACIPCSLLIALATLGCPLAPAPGHLAGAEGDTTFVHDPDAVLVHGPEGLVAVDLDGQHRRVLFPAGLELVDLSDDGQRFVLRGESGALCLGDALGKVAPLPGSESADDAALAPDGRHLALLHRLGPLAGIVSVVDVATLAAVELPGGNPGAGKRVAWAVDGQALWVEQEGGGLAISLRDGAERAEENPPFPLRSRPEQRARRVCAAKNQRLDADSEGLNLVGPQGVRRLVHIQGRRERLGDRLPAIDDAFFSQSCGSAVFTFDGAVWVVDLASGRLGRLATGDRVIEAGARSDVAP